MEQKFTSLDSLKSQIRNDVENTKKLCSFIKYKNLTAEENEIFPNFTHSEQLLHLLASSADYSQLKDIKNSLERVNMKDIHIQQIPTYLNKWIIWARS